MDTAPAIELRMMKKFRSRSAAVRPGMNFTHRSARSLIKPDIRFLTPSLVRAISGAKAAIGQPESG
ncbi:MAG TPA: hypothetical protein VKQ11_22525 [Candidatus Sulfotelmatobacter sp.]|nr:hypothetical protein [Candidatus Sulfotelmatobacter sp.]